MFIFSKPVQKTPFEQLILKDINSQLKVIRKKTSYFKNITPETDNTAYKKFIILEKLLKDLDKVIEAFNSCSKICGSTRLTALLLIDFLLIIERIDQNQKRSLGTHRSLNKLILYIDIGPVKDMSVTIEKILMYAICYKSDLPILDQDYPDSAKIIIDFTITIANVLRDILQADLTPLPHAAHFKSTLSSDFDPSRIAVCDSKTYGLYADETSLTFYWQDQQKEIKTVLVDKFLSSDELTNLIKTQTISSLHILATYKAILHANIYPEAEQSKALGKEEDLSAACCNPTG